MHKVNGTPILAGMQEDTRELFLQIENSILQVLSGEISVKEARARNREYGKKLKLLEWELRDASKRSRYAAQNVGKKALMKIRPIFVGVNMPSLRATRNCKQ